MGRWADGEMGRWGDGVMGRWGDGDIKQFYQIWEKETNFESNIIWRLLLQTDDWVYLFPALPSPAKPNQLSPLLAVNALRRSGANVDS